MVTIMVVGSSKPMIICLYRKIIRISSVSGIHLINQIKEEKNA
ncbi:MAG: hypothetical protein Q8N97_04855 [Methanobacteriaceae archaeon]|nr:hypothetical protein [Methanobacteriaceae archaeon]